MNDYNEILSIIMEKIGRIDGSVSGLKDAVKELSANIKENKKAVETNNIRVILALIGVVAAQIGVKVLGTPILLDIATFIGIISIFILIGALTQGWRLLKHTCKITRTGIFLMAMMICVGVVQSMVYFRDLGILSADVIYVARIFQNVSILLFAWAFITSHRLMTDINGNDKDCN